MIQLLDGIVDTGKPITANRTLTTLKAFFGWLIDRSVIDASPCARVKAPATECSRDRVLSDDEVALLWRAADDLGTPYALRSDAVAQRAAARRSGGHASLGAKGARSMDDSKRENQERN